MKDKKLNQILAAARQETPPVVPTGFAERVKHALVNEAISQPVVVAFWDQLNRNFTRYTVAAAAAIVICAAVEVSQAFSHDPTIDDDVEQICSDWMLR
jgi:negative regulator of sigma E activity